jgi:DNA-binding transcriptional regulator YiaG
MPCMPNIAALLKIEITRIARKQVREETQPLKKAIAPYRSEIATLKRRTQALEQQIKRLSKVAAKAIPAKEESDTAHRFSAKGLAKNRQRLGLSALDFGKLIDASALSVYKWEQGKVRPREKHLQAIAAIRTIGKKEAGARLEQLGA